MPPKSSASSLRAKRTGKSARLTKPENIDYSDLPEFTDEQLASLKPGRPLLGLEPRQLVSIRLDREVLAKLRSKAEVQGKGYQSLISEILAAYVKRS